MSTTTADPTAFDRYVEGALRDPRAAAAYAFARARIARIDRSPAVQRAAAAVRANPNRANRRALARAVRRAGRP